MASSFGRVIGLCTVLTAVSSPASAGLLEEFTMTLTAGPYGGGPTAGIVTVTNLLTEAEASYSAGVRNEEGGGELPGSYARSEVYGKVGDLVTDQFGTYIQPNIHLFAHASGSVPSPGYGHADFPPGGAVGEAKVVLIDHLIFHPLNPAQIFEVIGMTHDIHVGGETTFERQGSPSLEIKVADRILTDITFIPEGHVNKYNQSLEFVSNFTPASGGWESLLRIEITISAGVTGPGSSTASFHNTFEINNFAFFDQNGNPVYGTLTSALGFNYSLASPQAVPEPASLTLVGMGAFGLVAGAIRRRRQQKAAV